LAIVWCGLLALIGFWSTSGAGPGTGAGTGVASVAIFGRNAFQRTPIKNVRTLCFIELSLSMRNKYLYTEKNNGISGLISIQTLLKVG